MSNAEQKQHLLNEFAVFWEGRPASKPPEKKISLCPDLYEFIR